MKSIKQIFQANALEELRRLIAFLQQAPATPAQGSSFELAAAAAVAAGFTSTGNTSTSDAVSPLVDPPPTEASPAPSSET